MKLNLVKAKVIENASAAGLESDINTFFSEAQERTFVSVLAPFNSRTDSAGGKYSVVVLYTE